MTIPTWSGKKRFDYEGSVKTGTVIWYGASRNRISIEASQYARLLKHFGRQEVLVGTDHVNPPLGSLGEWLMENVKKTASASYVAPILVQEGYAVRASNLGKIRFFK
jgi:hypothetical protein